MSTAHTPSALRALQPTAWRRRALVCAAAASVLCGLGTAARADANFPQQPIKMVVGAPAGGAADNTVRVLARHMEGTLGQPVVVENRPGAASLIGVNTVVRAPADGYTIGLSTVAGLAILSATNPQAPDLRKDLTTLGGVVSAPHVLAVPASLPVSSASELLDLLRKEPGKYNFASQGEGSLSHLEGALFASLNKVQLQHIPYTGSSQAMPNLLAGATHMMFDSAASVTPHVRAGKLRVLGTAAGERLAAFPDAPTMIELGMKNFRADNPFGIYAPRNIPAPVAAKLSHALQQALADAGVQQSLRSAGMEPRFTPPADFLALVEAEYKLWPPVVKASATP